MRAPLVQAVAAALVLVLIAARHGAGDGLWFQGDAPRHAMNGLFWWDFLRTAPVHPVDYAVRYFARYPAISPATYPPVFYLLEGLAFAIAGASPYVSRALVLLFAMGACCYTLAWARRWLDPLAGWAGVLLALTPGLIVWSNSVMLNVPALALTIATLYHTRRWIESTERRHLLLTIAGGVASVGTYYQSAGVLAICGAFVLLHVREIRDRRQLAWLGGMALCALLPVAATFVLAPVQLARHLPPLANLLRVENWTFYLRALPELTGWPLLVLGGLGLAMGVTDRRWRSEAVYLAVWLAVLYVAMSILPAREARYMLLATPVFVLACAMGVFALSSRWQVVTTRVQLAGALTLLFAGGVNAQRTVVPTVSGIGDVATYLAASAPHDAVLYDGPHSGVFVFYVRALDPDFQRRVMLASKLLYVEGQRSNFDVVEETFVTSVDDVIVTLRTRSGCRYVAIEHAPRSGAEAKGRVLLRAALQRPDFTLVRSFPVSAWDQRRIDLYRLEGPVAPVTTVDLDFPAFSTRRFLQVHPVTR